MVSGDTEPSSKKQVRSYLIMRAEAQDALTLAEEWWEEKTIPTYVKIDGLDMDEIDEFVDLYNRCFLASPDPFCPLTIEQAAQLEPEGIFVAKLGRDLVGFIACFVERKSESIYGEITGIGVLPSRRRKGIATALIKQAAEYFIDSGVEEVYCEVYEENMPSKLLILAYGFKEVGKRDIPIAGSTRKEEYDEDSDLPGGKIMRKLGLRPRPGCESCRDL